MAADKRGYVMNTLSYISLALFAVAVAYYIIRLNAAETANVVTTWHSRHVGIIPVFPLTPFDQTVSVRAENLRNTFLECGNKNVEVVEYVFGLPVSKYGTASVTFDAFLRMSAVDYLQRCDAFIADKAKRDKSATAEFVAGQTFIVSNQNFLKP